MVIESFFLAKTIVGSSQLDPLGLNVNWSNFAFLINGLLYK